LFAGVVHDDRRRAAGCDRSTSVERRSSGSDAANNGWASANEGLVPHVEQRDFAPLDQGAANLSRRTSAGDVISAVDAPIDTAMQAAAAIVIRTRPSPCP
jgi:hypothetical protein